MEANVNEIRAMMETMGMPAGEKSSDFESFFKLRNDFEPAHSKVAFRHELLVVDQQACILPLGDLHIGLKNCNLKLIASVVKYILSRPNTYVILMGDQAETATRQSVGRGPFEQDEASTEQVKQIIAILRPLAKAGRILGIHGGNHEERLANYSGLDITQVIAEALDINFLGHQGYHVIHVGDQIYTGFSMHGRNRAAAKRARQIAVADLYFTGHTHELGSEREFFAEIDTETLEVNLKEKRSVVCGSAVDYWGSYAEMYGYTPQMAGFPLVILRADAKEIRVLS